MTIKAETNRLSMHLLVTLALALSAGCTTAHHVSRDTYLHMIAMDPEGETQPLIIDGGPDGPEHPVKDMDEHVLDIVNEIKNSGANHLLFFIHGGLVSMGEAIKNAEETLDKMAGEDFYPLFVNWESGLGSAYLDHLFVVRHGKRNLWQAIPTSPFFLLEDLGSAVMRLPVTFFTQARERFSYYFADKPVSTPERWEGYAWLDTKDQELSGWEVASNLVQEFVPGAARLATAPLLDAIGRSSYLNMRRRARVLLRTDADFASNERRLTGGLAILMARLSEVDEERRTHNMQREELERSLEAMLKQGATAQEVAPMKERLRHLQEKVAEDPPYRITIIAHSMGSIVANELIRSYAEFDYATIVYMAAACTIREFATTALTYIKEHDHVRFYNLCLHPRDDADDKYVYGILPYGSLLEWIDSFVTRHDTQMDNTLGKWQNVARTLPLIDYLPRKVRHRIIVRGFGRREGYPRDHGSFNDLVMDYPFWKEEFWDPTKDPRTRDRVPEPTRRVPRRVGSEFD